MYWQGGDLYLEFGLIICTVVYVFTAREDFAVYLAGMRIMNGIIARAS